MRYPSAAMSLTASALVLIAACGETATAPDPQISAVAPSAGTASIVNGTLVSETGFAENWPFAAALLVYGEPFCSASVLADRWVLTAAHCAEALRDYQQAGWQVAVGVGASAVTAMRLIPVAAVHIHADYSSQTLANDVALLELASDAEVESAQLPEESLLTGASLDVAGWGITTGGPSTALRWTTLTVGDLYGNRFLAESPWSGVCVGDSGGPAVTDGVLVGVHSYILGACDAGSGHSAVFAHLEWIETTSGITSGGPEEALAGLLADAESLPRLSVGTLKKLTGAQAALAAGKLAPACSKLAEFIDDITNHAGKRLTFEAAEDLIGQAAAIRATLGC